MAAALVAADRLLGCSEAVKELYGFVIEVLDSLCYIFWPDFRILTRVCCISFSINIILSLEYLSLSKHQVCYIL